MVSEAQKRANKKYRQTHPRKEERKRYKERYKKKYPEKVKAKRHRHYIKHRDELLIKHSEYRAKKGPQKWSKIWYLIYKESKPDKYKTLSDKKKKYGAEQRINITDQYVKKLIKDNYKIKTEIPEELIETYRLQIKVKRLLKKKKDENTKTS